MNMVERVARAMASREGWRWDDDRQMLDRAADLSANTSRERDVWRERARAAIEVQEPTEAMILAGYKALMEWDARTGEDHGIAEVWNAMRTAALNEQVPS